MITFDKIVKKMMKKGGKIFWKQDLIEIFGFDATQTSQSAFNKMIYRLKSQEIIIPLKAGVYIMPDEEDKSLNSIDLLDKYYFRLVKKYITYYAGSDYYISGVKALEIHMKNFSIPEKLYIMNRNINKVITIGEKQIIFKTSKAKIGENSLNLYPKLQSYVSDLKIEGSVFKISSLELSLIESALVSDTLQGVPIELLSKTIKKYKTVLQYDVFHELGSYKFSMSFNRLKEISKPIDENLYKLFLAIIKKNGGLFIGEGLRGF